jgi:hypothetical protein
MNDQEMIAKIKNALGEFDRMMPWALDKTDSRYSQGVIDGLYKNYKRLKSETANKLATPLSDSERANYETLLKDLDDHAAKVEPIVSNGLAGGKKRNKRSYKKSRRCSKKSKRCTKKRTSRRK